MSDTSAFIDTNVLLYLLSGDERRAAVAERILEEGGAITVQVLNEFASVALGKFGMTVAEVRETLDVVRALTTVRPVDVATHDLALEIHARYGFGLYDCLIVAGALLAGSERLITEDLQSGQVIEDRLTVHNPFSTH